MKTVEEVTAALGDILRDNRDHSAVVADVHVLHGKLKHAKPPASAPAPQQATNPAINPYFPDAKVG